MTKKAIMIAVPVFVAIVVGILLGCHSTTPAADDITGAGATFPAPIYSKWADAYKTKTGVGLNYQSIGSGGGIKQIEAKTVTFGATDAPLDKKELDANGLVQFPMVMGGIVPVVNVSGVKSGQLVLSGSVLANIFLGKITKWNDPAIAKLNKNAKLPSSAISVVHRSDGSGTSFNFTYYLSAVSPDWKSKVGTGKEVEWPVGIGSKGNEGVAASVQQTANSIGYVEYAYAKQNGLVYTDMLNRAGARVKADDASFAAAASNANWSSVPGYGVILANQVGDKSWPMTAATFILIHKKPEDAGAVKQALSFFEWAYANGDQMAKDLDYVPIPDAVVTKIKATWKSEIKDGNGKAVYGS